jgi:ABC-type ATPase involved in cell division
MPKARNRISGITVRGFKSVCAEQHLDIRPLTILAGANSAGKSSFMQPLLLLKQTLEAPGDPGALLMDGPNVRFTRAEQLLSRSSGKGCGAEFAVKIDLANTRTLELVFKKEEKRGFEIIRMCYTGDKEAIEVLPNMSHEAIVKVLPPHIKRFHASIEKQEKETHQWNVVRERCFLSFELVSNKEAQKRYFFGPVSLSPSTEFVPVLQGLIHLPGLRGNPRRDYPKASIGPDFQGTFEPYVASVISHWQSEKSEKLIQLGAALENMGLTWKVMAEPVDDTRVELKVGRLLHAKQGGARDLVSIADVGFGVSQALPVVVALLAAHPGQMVYLEQPEIHLHPLAQRRLARVLQSAAQRGVVVIVETHSALLLREVQTLIATGSLKRQAVALHWLQRGEDGSTVVHTADLDDQGAYGDWPEDFDITELDAEKAYLDAVEGKGPAQ